jgi:hypothetical protein
MRYLKARSLAVAARYDLPASRRIYHKLVLNYSPKLMKAKALLLIVFFAGSAHAQTRRALLVGIDHYIRRDPSGAPAPSLETKARLAQVHGRPSRSKITDLEGAVNDAVELRGLLIGKYKFEPRNIILLQNGEATADRILDALQKHLVDAAKPGDISFFYYAGHGSRIRNTLTKNPDGMDSALVPADTLLGVPDIRSKELDRIYLQARRRNVEFTVVEDSCFSGGGTRGPRPANRTRAADSDDQVSVAEALEGPLPEEQGVLFFSASQDYQPAQELREDAQLGKHGAFTWAFLQILASVGENERVDRIFQRTRALMQSKVELQEPVMLQSDGRGDRGLFGQPADPFGAATAAVGFVNADRGMLELNSGLTMGLEPGSELRRIEPPGNPPVRIRIAEVNGPSSANAAPIEPAQIRAIAAGNLFQLDKLMVPDKEFLKVYTGDALPFAQLAPMVRLAANLRAGGSVDPIDDPTESTPTHVLLWDGEKKRWILSENRSNGEPMKMEAASPDDIAKALSGRTPKARLAIVLPAPGELVSKLAFTTHGNVVSFTKSLEDADYFLIGRVTSGGGIEYAWARPSVTQEDMRRQYEAARRERQPIPLSGWPLRSDWVPVNDAAGFSASGARLTQQGLDLARVAGWLQLQTPIPDDAFPYGIALRDEKSLQLSDGELLGHRTYKIILRRHPLSRQTSVTPRRVYVFVVDSFGKGTLVFGTNLDNEFPRKDTEKLPDEIDLNTRVEVIPPYGVDNYYLLTSVQPIDDPAAVFNFEGVRTRGAGPSGPLEKLLAGHAAGTRGALSGVPTTWSIERIPFQSKDPNE